jgi:hypothetical protein
MIPPTGGDFWVYFRTSKPQLMVRACREAESSLAEFCCLERKKRKYYESGAVEIVGRNFLI